MAAVSSSISLFMSAISCHNIIISTTLHSPSKPILYKYHILYGMTLWLVTPRRNCQPRRSRDWQYFPRGDNRLPGMSPRKECYIYFIIPISTTNLTVVRHCRVTSKIITPPINQSDCWKLTWGIIEMNILWNPAWHSSQVKPLSHDLMHDCKNIASYDGHFHLILRSWCVLN